MNSNKNYKKEIHVSRNDIKETNHFKSLSPFIQKMALHRNNLKAIQHAINVISNVGFEEWQEKTVTRYNNAIIIQELIKTKIKNGN